MDRSKSIISVQVSQPHLTPTGHAQLWAASKRRRWQQPTTQSRSKTGTRRALSRIRPPLLSKTVLEDQQIQEEIHSRVVKKPRHTLINNHPNYNTACHSRNLKLGDGNGPVNEHILNEGWSSTNRVIIVFMYTKCIFISFGLSCRTYHRYSHFFATAVCALCLLT